VNPTLLPSADEWLEPPKLELSAPKGTQAQRELLIHQICSAGLSYESAQRYVRVWCDAYFRFKSWRKRTSLTEDRKQTRRGVELISRILLDPVFSDKMYLYGRQIEAVLNEMIVDSKDPQMEALARKGLPMFKPRVRLLGLIQYCFEEYGKKLGLTKEGPLSRIAAGVEGLCNGLSVEPHCYDAELRHLGQILRKGGLAVFILKPPH
jgi:hypothetical protein